MNQQWVRRKGAQRLLDGKLSFALQSLFFSMSITTSLPSLKAVLLIIIELFSLPFDCRARFLICISWTLKHFDTEIAIILEYQNGTKREVLHK